jgi:hypothetical protein
MVFPLVPKEENLVDRLAVSRQANAPKAVSRNRATPVLIQVIRAEM